MSKLFSHDARMILAGDIGGTSARLAVFQVADGALKMVHKKVYASQKHTGLEDIAKKFVAEYGLNVDQACFGIAGPVIQGRVETPNLSWVVDSQSLARELKLPRVSLINDLEANAHGIAALRPEDFAVINKGNPDSQGNTAVISAGTGLGEAGLFWDGERHRPFACEGGHCDFAPRNELETALLLHLLRSKDHVSWERVLSGPGLVTIYEFLRDTGRAAEPAALAAELSHARDASKFISEAGLAGKYEICRQALDLFVAVYGAEAGNLALKVMATGGVFIGGGIAPAILPRLQSALFLDSFLAKGRFKAFLGKIPVRVILNDLAALYGAGRFAALTASAL
jgi:glucokinase